MNGANEVVVGGLEPPADLATLLHYGLSAKLDLSEHLPRFTDAGLDANSLHAMTHWTRAEVSDALTRLLARRQDAPGLSPFQVIALAHVLRPRAVESIIEAHDDLPSTATLAEFLAHPMPGVALTHHLGRFFEQGIHRLADLEKLSELEDWVDVLKALVGAGAEERLTPFEWIVLEKGRRDA
ncbi:hypothetical protein C8F01DRAFT_1242685 [Mycena amicta]|nr:hypothetical protein C8F01DRAFT_1255741 [Mycena amicta]KAJ7074445.1 hypothetical protein C8F01DRAFT_1242685 [Mycena amicta]